MKDGEVSPSTDISPGSSYSVTCKDGYTLKGTATVTCTQSGSEATLATLPTCEEGNAVIKYYFVSNIISEGWGKGFEH